MELRREKIALAYWVRLKGSGEGNVTNKTLQECWEYSKFQGRGFGWTSKGKIRTYGMHELEFSPSNPFSSVPPWLFPIVNIDVSIVEKKREWQINEVGFKTSLYLRSNYHNYLKIYTDGSKNKEECVGIGIYIPEFKISISKRALDQLSVYTAEMLAVVIGLQWVEEVRPDRVVICTDSLSSLKSIQSTTTAREDILIELNHSLLRLHRGGIDLQFCWVPAHEGVKGNQCADKLVHYKRKSHYQFNLEKEKEKQ